ncbi:MAG: tetratricopeptide repeat protein [Desulfobacterales bacterium]|nr:MAG: tetratricopeptide repeat protein [Desulfobacterales bacterium]
MNTTLILSAVFSILQIVGLILLLVVLIKQFKHGGALNGIIGIITCGFWTFIWGWIKHKSLELTKVMVVWTIIIVAPIGLIGVFGVAIVNEMVQIATSLTEEGSIEGIMGKFEKKSSKKISNKKVKEIKATVKLPKKGSEKGRDWRQKAMALWENGKYTEPNKALDYWNNAIGTDLKSAEAFNNRGLAFYNLKQYQKAIKDYSQAIRMKPENSVAYNNRGNAYYELLRYELAEADFKKSIQLKPDYAKAYLNRGLVYYQQEKNDQACADFKKACDLGDCDGMQWAKKNGLCK